MVKFSGAFPRMLCFLQFSQNIDGFRQNARFTGLLSNSSVTLYNIRPNSARSEKSGNQTLFSKTIHVALIPFNSLCCKLSEQSPLWSHLTPPMRILTKNGHWNHWAYRIENQAKKYRSSRHESILSYSDIECMASKWKFDFECMYRQHAWLQSIQGQCTVSADATSKSGTY